MQNIPILNKFKFNQRDNFLTIWGEIKELIRDKIMDFYLYDRHELVSFKDGGQAYIDLKGDIFGFDTPTSFYKTR